MVPEVKASFVRKASFPTMSSKMSNVTENMSVRAYKVSVSAISMLFENK